MPRPALNRPNFRLRKHANGRWYIDWTEPRGKPQSLSAGTTDEQEAREALAEFEAMWKLAKEEEIGLEATNTTSSAATNGETARDEWPGTQPPPSSQD